MNQQEVEQWIAQQGGQGRVQYQRSTRQIDNPAADPMTAKNAGVKFDATADPKITVSEEKWVAVDDQGKPTGAELHVRRRPDGDFDIVNQANANPARASGEQTPEQKNAAELQRQRERNAALPADQDPAYETDEERRKRAQDRITQQGRDAEAARQRQRQDEADAERRAQNNRGTTTLKPDGKGGTVAVTTYPDGRAPTTAPVPGVPSEATSKYKEVKQDPTTGQWHGLTAAGVWEPIQGGPGVAGNQPLPAGMPTFRPDPHKSSFGLDEYVAQLTALRTQKNSDGTPKLTDQQFTDALTQAHQSATNEASRLDLIRSAQQQQQTNAINQRATDIQASVNRLNSANTATQNALDTSQKMAANFTPSSYAAAGGPILPAILALTNMQAQAWGGLNQPAPIGTENSPLLASLNTMGLTPSIPTVEQLVAGAQPNAIGVGAIGSVAAPGQPTAAPATAPSSPLNAPSPTAAPPVPAAVAPAPPISQQARDTDYRTTPAQAVPSAPTPAPSVNPDGSPDFGAPGMRVLPQTTPPAAGTPAQGNVQMASPAILPAVHQAGIMAELSSKYPADVLAEAARSLGWAA